MIKIKKPDAVGALNRSPLQAPAHRNEHVHCVHVSHCVQYQLHVSREHLIITQVTSDKEINLIVNTDLRSSCMSNLFKS